MHRLLLLLTLTALPLFSHAIEEPKFEVIRQIDAVELRQYAPYVVAEMVLDAAAENAGYKAFPIMADHIFGENNGEREFVLPEGVTLESAPDPMDPQVQLCQLLASQWATICYSGTCSKANCDEIWWALQ